MKKSQNSLVTKDYLNKKLQSFKVELKGELKEELKDDLFQIKDEIVGEIKDMRQEFNAHQFSHARTEETLDNHEKRLSTLEKPQ